MKILVLSGRFHTIVESQTPGHIELVYKDQLFLEDVLGYLEQSRLQFEGVLITDEGIRSPNGQIRELLVALLKYLAVNYNVRIPVVFITRDSRLYSLLQSQQTAENLKIFLYDYVRLPGWSYAEAWQQLGCGEEKNVKVLLTEKLQESQEKQNRIMSFFGRFRQKTNQIPDIQPTDELTKQYGLVSKSISRVIVVTGHRGSGLTSTTANLAYIAQKRGLSSIIVDMDLAYRSSNLYFGSFDENARRYEELHSSLIRCLARPQDYQTTAYNIVDNMWLTTLAYGFNEQRLIEQFYTSNKFISMLSVFRQKFNVVLIDMPLDVLGRFPEALIHIDVFGLCIPNSLHAVLSTIRNTAGHFNQEQTTYLNAKAKAIVTKYNDQARLHGEIFTPERVPKILTSELSDNFQLDIPLAGVIPYGKNFDEQIETDVLAAKSSTVYEQAYAGTLLRLLEGAN